jgi:hypothetical protein
MLQLKVRLPFLDGGPPFAVEGAGDLREEANRIVEEIKSTSDRLVFPSLAAIGTHRVRILEGSPRLVGSSTSRRPYLRLWRNLVFDISIDVDEITPVIETRSDGQSWELSTDEARKLRAAGAGHELLRAMFDLCVVANIAAPGAIDLGSPIVFLNRGRVASGSVLISSLQYARAYARRVGWPSIASLPFVQVWEWAARLRLAEKVGDSPVSRAYNAWTYLFGNPGEENPAEIFWALMGLEALYNDGKEGVRESVLRRTELLLGVRSSHKADLSDAYRVRSAYVHGNLPFPAKDFPYDAMTEVEEHREKIYGATATVSSVLAASLQQLVVRGWSSMRFETALVGELIAAPLRRT